MPTVVLKTRNCDAGSPVIISLVPALTIFDPFVECEEYPIGYLSLWSRGVCLGVAVGRRVYVGLGVYVALGVAVG